MTASDDFKKALRTGNLADAFAIAMGQAVNLKVTTWVAPSQQDFAPENPVTEIDPSYSLQTHLNLIEGKIENKIGDRFLGDNPYQEVRQFHLQQVQQGHQTLEKNLESLQKMFRLMATFQQQKLERTIPKGDQKEFTGNYQQPELESQTSQANGNNLSARGINHQNGYGDYAQRNGEASRERYQTNGNLEESKPHSQENGYFYPHTSAIDLDDEEEAIILSLEDLDPEPETRRNDDDEEWGDWLETDKDESIQTIDLKPVNVDKNENWTNGN
jgi:hypothetical protein